MGSKRANQRLVVFLGLLCGNSKASPEDAKLENVSLDLSVVIVFMDVVWMKMLVCSIKPERDRQAKCVSLVNNMPGSRPPDSGTFRPVSSPCALLGLSSLELGSVSWNKSISG